VRAQAPAELIASPGQRPAQETFLVVAARGAHGGDPRFVVASEVGGGRAGDGVGRYAGREDRQ
jgi:hypothetical protein